MKKVLGLALMLVAAKANAQSVEDEMTKLKRLAESCLALLSTQGCNATNACDAFKGYSRQLMPDGPAGYYELHGPDKSMSPGNGKLVSDAVKAESRAHKAIKKCIGT